MKKVLADFTKEYFNADNHTHKEIPFDVPEGLKEIRIKIAYSPKDFDDETASLAIVREVLKKDAWYASFEEKDLKYFLPLKNHISLSVDSPDGWLGTAHRHAPVQEHFINERESAYGFRPAPVTSGKWKITLSMNCIITGKVTVRVIVEGSDEIL